MFKIWKIVFWTRTDIFLTSFNGSRNEPDNRNDQELIKVIF